MLVPHTTRCGRLNGDAAFLLLLHEVRRGFAIVNLTRAVNFARELEDTLRRRGLARVYVGKNADISVFAEICHCLNSLRCLAVSRLLGSFGRG